MPTESNIDNYTWLKEDTRNLSAIWGVLSQKETERKNKPNEGQDKSGYDPPLDKEWEAIERELLQTMNCSCIMRYEVFICREIDLCDATKSSPAFGVFLTENGRQ